MVNTTIDLSAVRKMSWGKKTAANNIVVYVLRSDGHASRALQCSNMQFYTLSYY